MTTILSRVSALSFFVLLVLATFFTSSALQPAASRAKSTQSNSSSSSTALSLTSLFPARVSTADLTTTANISGDSSKVIPFVVTQVEKDGIDEMRSVSEMCVDVFFNEDKSNTPWRAMQLAYLRNLQYGDLRMKFFTTEAVSDMFVAREVLPADDADRFKKKIAVTDKIYNAKYLPTVGGDDYVLGDVLGFVEVTEKSFRLGEKYESSGYDGYDEKGRDMRPFLSNLSVREDARKSGVGSALVETCEESIRSWPRKYNEIVLQVEDENTLARKFYEKRGYRALFADPACRRFDTTGWMLRKVPTTKVAMRKMLSGGSRTTSSTGGGGQFSLEGIFGNLRQLVGN